MSAPKASEPGASRLPPWLERHGPSLLLVALSVPVVFVGLGQTGLVNTDEEIYHVVAERMWRSGDFATLWFYEQHRVYDTFMNAPLQYWVRAAGIALLGSHEWSMRIPTAICAVLALLATRRLGERLGGRGTGLLSGLLLLFTYQFVFLHGARTGELEPAVAALYVGAVLGFLRGLEEDGHFVAHHLCVALLLNVKTPTALIPLLGAGLCFAALPATRSAAWAWLRTAAWVLPLGAAWHLWHVFAMWPEFVSVMGEMADDAAERPEASAWLGRLGNLFFYLQTVAFGAFPQCLAFPFALVWAWRAGRDARAESSWRIVVLFAVAVAVFYLGVARIHRWYIVPAYPLLSVLAAGAIASLGRRAVTGWSAAAVALGVAAVAVIRVPVFGYNPFAEKAWLIPMELGWQPWTASWPWLAVLAVGGVAFAGLRALETWRPDRSGRVVAVAVVMLLLGYGGLRTLAGLRFVGHRSAMARLHDRLDASGGARTIGRYEPDIPIGWDARFYFGRDWDIELVPRDRFVLHARGTAPRGARIWPTGPPVGRTDSSPSGSSSPSPSPSDSGSGH